MNNYIFRNLALFIGVILMSILGIGILQYFSFDQAAAFREKKELEQINKEFERRFASIIQQKFNLIDFLTNTSYPSIAITFGMDQQFNATVERLDNGSDPLGILLFDSPGNLVAHRHVDPVVADVLKKKGLASCVESVFCSDASYVTYTKAVYIAGAGDIGGYLVGIRPTGTIMDAVRSAYRERTLKYTHFKPDLEIAFPNLILTFKHVSPDASIFASLRKGFIQILPVAGIVLALFSYLLWKSLKKPVQELLNIVHHVSKGSGDYSGPLPKDRIFNKIADSLLTMHHHRSVLESEKRQREVAERLEDIALKVAHDILSPLSSLQAAVGMIREGKKTEDAANLLELSAQRLTGIADDLLKKHKGEGETHTVFSLHQVLDELVGEFQGRSEYKDIAFVKHYFSSAIHLNGSPAKLQRAFGNIIKNAVEAMKGQGRITLTTGKPNGQAVVSIADSGPGMAPETLTRVLRGGYTQGKEEGHGIGMRVVQETVEEFGGSLTAQSEGGKGTTFTVELPLRAAREEAYTLEVPSDKIPVLVVDDEPSIREQWRLVLKERGLAALLCASYEDVTAQKIGSALVQTAVVDYHFDNSEKNGADVVRYLQAQDIRNITLCTAEYWKPSIKKLADELNVKLCPKPLPKIVIAEKVSLRGSEATEAISPGTTGDCFAPLCGARNDKGSGYKVLVIDDEEGIRLSWDVLQEKFGIARLYAFPNLEALLSDGVDLQFIDVAFVDKNIENSQYSGADVIAYLKKKGVPKVVLASGENEERLRKDPQFALADFISGEKIPESLEVFLL